MSDGWMSPNSDARLEEDDAQPAPTHAAHEAPADGSAPEVQQEALGAEHTNVHASDQPRQGEAGYVDPTAEPEGEEEPEEVQ